MSSSFICGLRVNKTHLRAQPPEPLRGENAVYCIKNHIEPNQTQKYNYNQQRSSSPPKISIGKKMAKTVEKYEVKIDYGVLIMLIKYIFLEI